MYSYEDRLRAVRLYIKLDKRLGLTIRQLGYPTNNTLKHWQREHEQRLDLPVGYARRPKYSQEQRELAVRHFLEHGPQIDLQSIDTTPNFVFITPNLCDDGHDGDGTGAAGKGCKSGAPGGLTSIDAFLQKWIPIIQASAAYKQDGLIVINFDESNAASAPMTTTFNANYTQMNLTIDLPGASCCTQQVGPNVKRPDDQILSTIPIAYASSLGINVAQLPASVQTIQIGMHYDGVGGDRTGAVLLSPFIKAGTTTDTGYNHYSLLKSLENLFGTPEYLGYADDANLTPFGSDIFNQ